MISRHLLRVAFLLLCLPVAITSARAQSFFNFPDTPCDSTRCDSLFFTNEGTTPRVLYSIRMRDSVSFSVAPLALPNTIPAGDRLALSVCFTPNRKGTISDSLRLYIRTATGFDTIRVRLSGKGIGPSIVIAPSALLLFSLELLLCINSFPHSPLLFFRCLALLLLFGTERLFKGSHLIFFTSSSRRVFLKTLLFESSSIITTISAISHHG
ncbi:MAG: hypothetical protein ABI876_12610, partial [Bacteroidota bacterium]